jgi:putative tryptophan/tyrosine transport system substrate-binding protein
MNRSRRTFLHMAAGAAVIGPVAASAQQSPKVPRIGLLISFIESDSEAQSWIRALLRRLEELGWIDGRNIHIDYRWPGSDVAQLEAFANELILLQPTLLIAAGTPAANSLRRTTHSIPVVMVQVADPVELGLVASLSRPGGNFTGFSNYELSIGGKWLEALRQVAPQVARVGVLVEPENPSWSVYLRSVQLAAPPFNVELIQSHVRTGDEIERAIGVLAQTSNAGLLVLPAPATLLHRELIVRSSVRGRVPAVFPYRFFAELGGLISYSVDLIDMYERAAGYVDRILKGAKPADLPVQTPSKYQLVLNLKTARMLGLTIPRMMLARADELIE